MSASVLVTEDFTGAATSFEANSSNVIGNTTINLVGGVNDPGPTGLTGSGFFQGEVDSAGTDVLSLLFSFEDTHGFALSNLQNDSDATPSSLDLSEIALSTGGEQWILSNFINGTESDLPFLGFVSDALLDSFSFFHAGKVSSVSRTSEEFYLDGLITAETPAPVPEPPVIFMLMIGLLSMIAAIRVKRN